MTLDSALPLTAAIAYTLLLVSAFIRRRRQSEQMRWLLGFLGISVLWQLSRLLALDAPIIARLSVKVLLLATTFLGLTTTVYLDRPEKRRWVLLGAAAIVTSVVVDLLPGRLLFIPGVSLPSMTSRTLATYVTWGGLSGYLLIRTWGDYSRTRFPWHANRLLYWFVALLLTVTGELILFSDVLGVALAGQGLRFLGVLGIAYATFSHRVFDVRTKAQQTLAFIIIMVVSALPVLTAVFLLYRFFSDSLSSNSLFIITGVIVTVGFFLYQPLHNAVARIAHRYLVGETVTTNRVLRDYSQAISRTLDVQQLSLVIVGTLSELLRINRGALVLLTRNEDNFEAETIPAMGQIPRRAVELPANGLFVDVLEQGHQPLLQYEIDFNPEFNNLSAEERIWLQELFMEVYVPISAGDGLEGIIAIGPKSSGVPYQPGELDLVQMLADQTVVALQNARLYSELEAQNEKVRHLNVDLVNQNERLEIMDRVKSDFITIASHELRTPLTQVKGYTDILSAMNDEDSLSREQTRDIVSHINRATDQLDRLITAMLDASQLDVEGMRLTFMQASIETILRLAVEQLAPAMRERRIQFAVEGATDVPTIQADFKRLVQAFTNIIGNAVKYTPDHGEIMVTVCEAPTVDEDEDYIEIMVADTGIGIDPQFHELVFEKFFRIGDPQLHSTGSTKFKGAGPGLGLHIAKGVIEAHSGRIWVESEGEDEERLPGTRVHIILPVQPPDALITAENGANAEAEAERPAYLWG